MNSTTNLRSTDPRLSARVDGDRVVFEGDRFGAHSLAVAVSSPERVAA